MATARVKTRLFKVNVSGKPNYCGEGAGGAQFAHGESVITSEHLARWFDEHEGYEVEEIKGE